MIAGAAGLGLVGGLGGATLLRTVWTERARSSRWRVPVGWLVLTAAIVFDAVWVGPVKGLALGVAMVAIGALLVVARGRVRRVARAGRETSLAPEPFDGPSRGAWRGWVKALLAGPLGMTAAMALAFCYATWAPGDPRTRLIVAGLLVPFFWALAMTWTLADHRLLRSVGMLVGTTVAGFALAAVKGLA